MEGNVPSSWTLELCDSPVRAEPGVHECCCDSDESNTLLALHENIQERICFHD